MNEIDTYQLEGILNGVAWHTEGSYDSPSAWRGEISDEYGQKKFSVKRSTRQAVLLALATEVRSDLAARVVRDTRRIALIDALVPPVAVGT